MNKTSSLKETNNMDNISLTAYRIISIFKLLNEKPVSDKDINIHLQNIIPESRPLSQDTIGIYINTLKAVGCNISRPKKSNDYKFELIDHPFKPNISKEEISALFNLRKFIVSLDDWKLIVETEKLLERVINSLTEVQKNEYLSLKKTLFRGYSLIGKYELIDTLEKYCNKKRYVNFHYESASGNEKLINLVAEKLSYENDALYLWGFDVLNDEIRYYRVDRINKITTINIVMPSYSAEAIKIKYKLSDYSAEMFTPSSTDIIVEEANNVKIITSQINNKFKFFQDILSYGSECIILEPLEIKEEHIKRLSNVLKYYTGEN